MVVDPIRLAVGRMAQHLASGYYAFLVAHLVAVNPQSINSLPPAKTLRENPTGEIKRKDGTFHTLDLRFYLDLLRTDQSLQGEFLRAWATGALLVLVRHRNADPPWMKPVALSGGRRRRGRLFLWCERARVLVGPGASEAPPIAPRAARSGSALFIPSPADQYAFAQSRIPIDMMVHGRAASLFHASAQWSTMSS